MAAEACCLVVLVATFLELLYAVALITLSLTRFSLYSAPLFKTALLFSLSPSLPLSLSPSLYNQPLVLPLANWPKLSCQTKTTRTVYWRNVYIYIYIFFQLLLTKIQMKSLKSLCDTRFQLQAAELKKCKWASIIAWLFTYLKRSALQT